MRSLACRPIFFGTSIPTTVIILKKNRSHRDVLFIDASQDFEKQKNKNVLLDEHIDKIVSIYKNEKILKDMLMLQVLMRSKKMTLT